MIGTVARLAGELPDGIDSDQAQNVVLALLALCLVGIFVVAAIMTPPDVMSQTLLAVPAYLLYEPAFWLRAGSPPRPTRSRQIHRPARPRPANRFCRSASWARLCNRAQEALLLAPDELGG